VPVAAWWGLAQACQLRLTMWWHCRIGRGGPLKTLRQSTTGVTGGHAVTSSDVRFLVLLLPRLSGNVGRQLHAVRGLCGRNGERGRARRPSPVRAAHPLSWPNTTINDHDLGAHRQAVYDQW
jgi:hypothetical protein